MLIHHLQVTELATIGTVWVQVLMLDLFVRRVKICVVHICHAPPVEHHL